MMGRIFSWLSAIAVLMVLIAGAGVYWCNMVGMTDIKRESAMTAANTISVGIATQINLLNSMLDKMAEDPAVISALLVADPVLLEETASKLEKHMPEVLKIRLLLPNVSETDEKSLPRMGFADLEMVQQSLLKNQSPAIQGDKGVDRHLAIARRVMQNNQVMGVLLASLDEQLINKMIRATHVKDIAIELKQASLILAKSSDQASESINSEESIKIANTDWEINYSYVTYLDVKNALISGAFIIIPALIVLVTLLIGKRNLSEILTRDLQSLIKAFKDLMSHQNMPGNYPVHLEEMNAIISNLKQYTRVLDKGAELREDFGMNIVVKEDREFDLDGYFDSDLKL